MRYTIKDGWMTVTGKANARPFVARVTGISDKWGLEREFVSTSEVVGSSKVPAGTWRARFEIKETRILELGGWSHEGADRGPRVYGEIKGGVMTPIILEQAKALFMPADVAEEPYDAGLPF